jgi:multiple sugar transport system permease protein
VQAGVVRPGRGRRPRLRTWRDDPWLAVALCLPALLVLAVFHMGPALVVFAVSFTRWDLGRSPVWIGLKNFTDMLRSPDFWHSLQVTGLFTVGNVLASLVLALAASVLMAGVIRGRAFYRSAYFLPNVTPLVSTSVAWMWVFEPDHGLINSLLGLLHIHGPAWLYSTAWALPAVTIFSVWHDLGFGIVLFLAGLTGVPRELQEAAAVDGAGSWEVFRYVTWPLLTPVTFLYLILATVASLRTFTQIYTLAQGGPVNATTVTTYYIYEEAFQFYHFGYGSAASVALFIIIAAVVAIQFRVAGRRVFYGR